MSKQKQDRKQEKNMKMAEAGVLFVLVLGLLVFVGVHFSGDEEQEPRTAALIETVEPASAEVEPALVDPTAAEVTLAEVEPAPEASPSAEPELMPEPEPDPEPLVVTYSTAEDAYHAREYAHAAELFDAYTDQHPANAWGYYMLGLSQWKAGEADMAEESFLAALELKPDHQKSLVNYGRVLIDLGRHEEAREQIEIALAVNPESLGARRVLGRVQHNLGQLEDAEQTYLVVLREKQDDAWALNNLGLIRIEQERFEDAIAPLAKAASLQTEVACFENNLGVALERSGYYGPAGEAFARALIADSGYTKAETSLARIEEMIGTEQDTIDVAALAESFFVEPAAPQAEDMEVAAAGEILLESLEEEIEPATTEVVAPEADGHRNR